MQRAIDGRRALVLYPPDNRTPFKGITRFRHQTRLAHEGAGDRAAEGLGGVGFVEAIGDGDGDRPRDRVAWVPLEVGHVKKTWRIGVKNGTLPLEHKLISVEDY